MSVYQDYKELKTLFRKWYENKVPMSPEVMRLYWKELKRLERETRCRNADGNHCMEDCRMCEKQRDGAPLSLDQQIEIDDLLQDTFCTEALAEYRELLDSFHAALKYMIYTSSPGYHMGGTVCAHRINILSRRVLLMC